MSTSEERIKNAFDEIRMPEGIKDATLKMIEDQAPTQVSSVSSDESTLLSGAHKGNVVSGDDRDHVTTSSPSAARARRTTVPFIRRVGFALAACLILCVVGFGGFSAYGKETAVIGIELNPSIELGVNRFDIVVDARALNEDGEHVLSKLSVTGKSSDEALSMITQSDAFQSYITEDSFVDVYVICDDEKQSSSLVSQGQQSINSLPCDGTSNHASSETKHEAEEHGMGVSRYEAAKTLISLDVTLTIDDCESMSMKEMRGRIASLDPDNPYAETHGSQNGEGQGYGHGEADMYGQGNASGNAQGSQDSRRGTGQQGQSSGNGSGGAGQGYHQGSQQGKQHGRSAT